MSSPINKYYSLKQRYFQALNIQAPFSGKGLSSPPEREELPIISPLATPDYVEDNMLWQSQSLDSISPLCPSDLFRADGSPSTSDSLEQFDLDSSECDSFSSREDILPYNDAFEYRSLSPLHNAPEEPSEIPFV